MSMLADIQSTLSEQTIREKLTLEERAKLLIDIINCLQWTVYEMDNGEDDLYKAMIDLSFTDKEDEQYRLKKLDTN